MKTVSASFTHLGPPARFCKPPSPFSKGSPPRPGTILPLHSSPNGHLGWQGDPPPHPAPRLCVRAGPPLRTLSSGLAGAAAPRNSGDCGDFQRPPYPPISRKPHQNPTPHPELPHCLLRLQETPPPGNSVPLHRRCPRRGDTPPPKPRGNRGAAISFFQLVSLLCIRTHSNCER